MKRLFLVVPALSVFFSMPSQAGLDQSWTITWAADVSVSAVPTVTEWQLLLMSLLLVVLAVRVLQRNKGLASVFLASAVGLGTLSAALFSEAPNAGRPSYATLEASSCDGSSSYSVGENPPPCFKNTCGQPVTVTLEHAGGEEGCDVAHYCDEDGVVGALLSGDTVPSNGSWYALPYCEFGD